MSKKKSEQPDSWGVAFHEAGHAVALVAFGIKPDSVALLDPSQDLVGVCRSSKIGFSLVKSAPAVSPEREAQLLDMVDMIVTGAGPIAEAVSRGATTTDLLDSGGGSDWAHILTLSKGFADGETATAQALLGALRIVREHWEAIEDVAEVLEALGVLSGASVVGIAHGAGTGFGCEKVDPEAFCQ